ncbi:MAG: FAD-dependent oxidoreductase [Acidobacteriota bacterium]
MAEQTVVVGAGPAGLTAALELGKLGRSGRVFEADPLVGGISRSVEFQGNRLDIGGHRFFTKVREVEDLWHEILGDDLLTRERMSRIYYRDTLFDYPLKPLNALRGLGVAEAVRVVLSYGHAQLFPARNERTFDAWVSNRFGRRLFEIFFETYTEKVWGMPCSEISAAWAAQRIKNLDLLTAVKNAFLGNARGAGDGEVVTSLIERFLYPRLGPGMMWERCAEMAAERGLPTELNARVVALHHKDRRIHAVDVQTADGLRTQSCDHLISSMPITALVRSLSPAAPSEILAAADGLRYRDFLIIGLVVDREHLFPDNWIYVHSPDVRVGRVQSFKNWSPEMVADPSTSFLGLEYFVDEGDDLWSMGDDDLIELGAKEGERLRLFEADEVQAGTVIRMPKAYPVYDDAYEGHLETIRGWLETFENLQTIGRNGQHRYNNQDHSMVAGLWAARNVAGADLDLWSINVEQDYHEESRSDAATEKGGDRLTPERVQEATLHDILEDAFSQYDEVAMGGAVGLTASIVLAVATLFLLVGNGEEIVPMMSLLGQYLFGYQVSWAGTAVGMLEVALAGFALGWITARLINRLTSAFERGLERRLALLTTLED